MLTFLFIAKKRQKSKGPLNETDKPFDNSLTDFCFWYSLSQLHIYQNKLSTKKVQKILEHMPIVYWTILVKTLLKNVPYNCLSFVKTNFHTNVLLLIWQLPISWVIIFYPIWLNYLRKHEFLSNRFYKTGKGTQKYLYNKSELLLIVKRNIVFKQILCKKEINRQTKAQIKYFCLLTKNQMSLFQMLKLSYVTCNVCLH